ncbi:succinyl-CoA synthetase [Paenibacillus sp. DLE-14]|uniref:Succinyl-CoA synthetase n=2 Tax=Paenibacillus lignilyticus TaxID=1172615 RepID=A0ABS5C7U3_9BACL|nr:succinyl-CoA synthetase [Paenibacillus lignilyticus]
MEHGQFHDNAFTAGYELGKYEGGELLLEQVLPMNLLLPEVRLQDVIALGAEHLRPRCLPLMDVHEVYAEMEQAIHERRPCAVVRLGDGELLTLAQDAVYDTATIQREGTFLPYAGVNPPDLLARDQLLHAIRHAHVVGVPLARRKHFHPLLHPVFRAHHLDPATLRMTNSTVNYGLSQTGLLGSLLAGKQLLVIGNAAPALAHMLSERGFIVSGLISPVRGVRDVERVILESRHVEFDLALVSAGIAAVMICTRIAHERGKTALDFGHMADAIVKGQVALTH